MGNNNKVLKAGFMIPPLFVNFKFDKKQEIYFYPFISKNAIIPYTLSEKVRRANYKMFRYNLKEMPKIKVYPK